MGPRGVDPGRMFIYRCATMVANRDKQNYCVRTFTVEYVRSQHKLCLTKYLSYKLKDTVRKARAATIMHEMRTKWMLPKKVFKASNILRIALCAVLSNLGSQ